MNDSSVSSIGINQLKSSQPYILFYIKKIKEHVDELLIVERKRKDSAYEEGDLHCKRKESRSYSIDSEPNTKLIRKMSVDSRESMSKFTNHKSMMSDNANEIDHIFSTVVLTKAQNGPMRKYSKDLPMLQNKETALPTIIDKSEVLKELEMTKAIKDVLQTTCNVEKTKPVILMPVLVSETNTMPQLSVFSKQFRINKLNKFGRYYNPPITKPVLTKKNFNESRSPTPSAEQNFGELIEDFDRDFGFVPKRKDSYDAEYDKGKTRKLRTRKTKKFLDFQKVIDLKDK